MLDDHLPILLKEVIEGLAIRANGVYVDATFGRGGHSLAILNYLGPNGRLIALDKDPEAVAMAKKNFSKDSRFSIEQASFAELIGIVKQYDYEGEVNGIVLDLGISSPQLEDPKRGFSFTKEGPLDMRMDTTKGMDAATWINRAQAHEIARILREYGEERYANRIARVIVHEREKKKIMTTTQLAAVIAKANPSREQKKHPATRSFQAIRIFINHELEDLKKVLEQSLGAMSVGGRICVISFHSLEDRIVKQFIQRESQGEKYPPDLPIKEIAIKKRLRKVGSLIRPTAEEVAKNWRARSARLRIAEKVV